MKSRIFFSALNTEFLLDSARLAHRKSEIVPRRHLTAERREITGGRWNSPGSALVYTASSLPLAVLEILVHLPRESILSLFTSIPVEFSAALVSPMGGRLPADWRLYPAPQSTMQIGDKWLRAETSAILEVPSVIVPTESNFLLNPAHQDFAKIVIGKAEPFPVGSPAVEGLGSGLRVEKSEIRMSEIRKAEKQKWQDETRGRDGGGQGSAGSGQMFRFSYFKDSIRVCFEFRYSHFEFPHGG